MQKTKTVRRFSKAQLIRAVASSTAVETREPVSVIEARLLADDGKKGKFSHMQLYAEAGVYKTERVILMNAIELVKRLNECIEEYGDLDVYVEADHGQTPEGVFSVEVFDMMERDGEINIIHPDDVDEFDAEELEKIICIN